LPWGEIDRYDWLGMGGPRGDAGRGAQKKRTVPTSRATGGLRPRRRTGSR
jgi:hypothetical protein